MGRELNEPGFRERLTSVAALREHFRAPTEIVQRLKVDHLDAHCRAFVERAPLLMIGTSSPDGTGDVSPRGGPPGFTVVLDEHRLAIPDLSGNNLLDTLTNLVTDPAVGLLFLIPGLDETLRVNGRACITRDPAVLDACTVKDRRPKAAIGVDVQEAYLHCAKAFRRGSVWEPHAWRDRAGLATPACIMRDHMGLHDVSEPQMAEDLEAEYRETLWETS